MQLLDIKKKLGSARLIIVAIGAYASIDVSKILGYLIVELLPLPTYDCASYCDWLEAFAKVISFSLTGFLFGICLWLLYEKSAKQLVKFIPLFGLLALYIWANRSQQELSLPVEGTLEQVIQLLTGVWGLAQFVFLPLSVFGTILLLERYSYKQIARVVTLAFVVLLSSRFIYTLTPQYQQEQAKMREMEFELQLKREAVQRSSEEIKRLLQR